MIYRLKELKGDTIPVPQLIFSKLGIAEEYNVRVALYVLATGITDPDKLCADLKLRHRDGVALEFLDAVDHLSPSLSASSSFGGDHGSESRMEGRCFQYAVSAL